MFLPFHSKDFDSIEGVIMKTVSRIIIISVVSSLMLCSGLWAEAGSYVDAYSSASDTKTTLTGPAFDAAAGALEAGSAVFASAADAKAPGYEEKMGATGHIMSTNPDGSVGISTIGMWIYARGGVADTLKLQLTEGQNALNLAGVDRRGTLFVPGLTVGEKEGRYFVHFKVVDVDKLAYSKEAYEAGKFNAHYSGSEKKKSQFTLTCEVLSIEEVSTSVKLGFKMP
jgi:hypothetical protein